MKVEKGHAFQFRGCYGFDSEVKYESHAEGFGWPLKKTGKTINAKPSNVISFDFAATRSDCALVACAA